MSVKLIHGLQNGIVVKVTDVGNGLACNCICIDCKSRLIAVNNPGISCRPHFRHSDTKEKEIKACKASFETAIHYQAKDIIEKNCAITLPAYFATVNKHNGNGIRKHLIEEQKPVNFDRVINENRVSTSQGYQDIKPDLIAIYKDHRLFIEVAVTHPAEQEKIESFKRHNVSAIEIDLSKFPRTGNEEDLEKYLNKRAPVKWLYHINHEKFYQIGLEKENKKEKSAEYFTEKNEAERIVREIKDKEKYLERLQISFRDDLESEIFNRPYEGYLFDRIFQLVKSKHSHAINCYRRNGFLNIEHQIAGLGEIYFHEINGPDDNFQIESDFIGLQLNISEKLKGHSIENIGSIIIANIYYKASLALCDNIEIKISHAEEERQVAKKKQEEYWGKLKLEQEIREQNEIIKKERTKEAELDLAKREEQERKIKLEERKIELAKQDAEEEKLFINGIKELLERNKKNTPWKKDYSVAPKELFSFLKIKILNFNNEKFIDIRLRLQNKGLLNKVDANKLATANL